MLVLLPKDNSDVFKPIVEPMVDRENLAKICFHKYLDSIEELDKIEENVEAFNKHLYTL